MQQGYSQPQYGGGPQQYNASAPPPQYGQQNGYQQNGYQQNGYQQEGYQNPMAAPQGYGNNHDYSNNPNMAIDGKQDFTQAFQLTKPRYNDLWAGIAFILTFLGFVAVSVYCLTGYGSAQASTSRNTFEQAQNFGLNHNTIGLFGYTLVVSVVLSILYFAIARAFTKQIIWISGIVNILAAFASAGYFFYAHAWAAGAIGLLIAVFTLFCFFTWIPRIPFSTLMFQTVVDVSKRVGHVYMVSFIGGITAALFGAWFAATLCAVYARFEPSNPNGNLGPNQSRGFGAVAGLFVFVTFAGYWITEWLKNTIHVVISGVYGSWYFNPMDPPRHPTRGAARRALTYSFGSISLGSLFIAILDFLRLVCSVARNQEANSGNFAADCALCILGCILSLINWALEFLNRYAFSYMALYGDNYITSAKQTWKLIKDRGIDALINECLINPVLSLGSSFVGVCSALFAYLYLKYTLPPYNTNGDYTAVILLYAFLIGLQVCACFIVPLTSGIDTFFVAAAWDPETLMRKHGDLYGRMVQVYPHVQQAIHA